MRRPFVAANWKMHGRLAVLRSYARALGPYHPTDGPEVVVCPPVPYLRFFAEHLSPSASIALGAQDCSVETDDGAYTGEISAAMLADIGCRWVIVGHSERRHRYGETDAEVAAKFQAAVAAGLSAILCVGETHQERDAGRARAVVLGQLDSVLEAAGPAALEHAVIAYEPVWAIGSGVPATAQAVEDMQGALRLAVTAHGRELAESLRIVYGGSVTPGNAAQFLGQPSVDGALVGGAALDADEFLAIVRAARNP